MYSILTKISKKILTWGVLILYNTATLRISGALEKSSEVMKYMQQLVKIPEIQATMQELSKEMMKVCKWMEGTVYITNKWMKNMFTLHSTTYSFRGNYNACSDCWKTTVCDL